jgi:hypothetical protein
VQRRLALHPGQSGQRCGSGEQPKKEREMNYKGTKNTKECTKTSHTAALFVFFFVTFAPSWLNFLKPVTAPGSLRFGFAVHPMTLALHPSPFADGEGAVPNSTTPDC